MVCARTRCTFPAQTGSVAPPASTLERVRSGISWTQTTAGWASFETSSKTWLVCHGLGIRLRASLITSIRRGSSAEREPTHSGLSTTLHGGLSQREVDGSTNSSGRHPTLDVCGGGCATQVKRKTRQHSVDGPGHEALMAEEKSCLAAPVTYRSMAVSDMVSTTSCSAASQSGRCALDCPYCQHVCSRH